MASLSPKAGGVFRTSVHVWAKTGGIWRDCQQVFVRSGGVWRQVFTRLGLVNPLPSASSIGSQAIGGGNASGSVSFNGDGTVTYPFTGLSNSGTKATPNWYATTAGIGSSWSIRATVTVGTLTTGTTGAWVSLSAGQTFTKGPAASATTSCTLTFDFSSDGGTTTALTSAGWMVGYEHI